MNDIKMTVSFIIPGATMYKERECEAFPELYKEEIATFVDKRKKSYKSIKVRSCIPVIQNIKMFKDAYDGMINDIPSWSNNKEWNRLSKKQRIETHLKRIMQDLHASSFDYHIFED